MSFAHKNTHIFGGADHDSRVIKRKERQHATILLISSSFFHISMIYDNWLTETHIIIWIWHMDIAQSRMPPGIHNFSGRLFGLYIILIFDFGSYHSINWLFFLGVTVLSNDRWDWGIAFTSSILRIYVYIYISGHGPRDTQRKISRRQRESRKLIEGTKWRDVLS